MQQRLHRQTLHPGWTLVLVLVLFAALSASLPERRMWNSMVSCWTFAGLQWLLPQCRFRLDHPFSPINVALFLFLLRLVIVPILMMVDGPESRILSSLPLHASMEMALLIDTVAHVAFCAGLALRRIPGPDDSVQRSASSGPGVGMTLAFVALGLFGFAAAFGSPGRLIEYFLQPSTLVDLNNEQEGTMRGLAGTLLRPFLAFAMVAWWSRIIDRPGTGVSKATLAGMLAAVVITLANLTFSFNRAAFVFPLVSLAALYHARVQRFSLAFIATAGLAAFPVLMGLEAYRANMMLGQQTDEQQLRDKVLHDTSETIQAYAVGPQYTATFYDREDWGRRLYWGSMLLSSAMSPVPVLGKGFRDTSGPVLYNKAIYDQVGIEDQILPFNAELFVNFHLPGVAAGYLLFGLALAWAHGQFERAGSSFAAFTIQYAAQWGATLAAWSVSIYSQILLYFFVPVYFYVLVLMLQSWLRLMAGGSGRTVPANAAPSEVLPA